MNIHTLYNTVSYTHLHPDVLVGVILYQTAVLQHVVVAAVDDIHPFLVVHGKPVLDVYKRQF